MSELHTKKKILIVDRKKRLFVQDKSFTRIFDLIRKEIDVEIFWLLVNPEVKSKTSPLKINYKNFEDYKTDNIQEILKDESPNLVIIVNDYDFLIRAFIPAAKKLEIPTVLMLQNLNVPGYLENMDIEFLKTTMKIVHQNWKDILSRFWIMIKNYRYANFSIFSILKIIFSESFIPLKQFKQPRGKYGCDLILVSGNAMKKELEKYKMNSKIVLTGRALLDDLYYYIQSYKNKTNKKLMITLMTTPLVEHKMWSVEEWETTILEILQAVNNLKDVDLQIKIHPLSENLNTYKNLLSKNNLSFPIFQKEELERIIMPSDIVITYGYSSGTLEANLMKKPVIVINLYDYPLEKMPFVKYGLAYELNDIKKLKQTIEKINIEKIDDIKLSRFISDTIFKFDGKATKRSAEAILDILNQKIY